MFTLHRYFLTASAMRSTFLRWMKEHPEGPLADDSRLFPEFVAHMSVWYSTLFTAWEGWNQLAAQYGYDDVLTRYWEDPLRVMLQDYRNATMHYSRRYLDARLTAFIADESSAAFAHNVHHDLGQAILGELGRLATPPDVEG